MAQKKLPKLESPTRRQLQVAAKTAAGAQALGELADRMLAESDTNAWRNVSEEHKEIICYRIRGGELLSTVCRSLGIDPGNIRNLAAMDDEFDQKLTNAYASGSHAQVERLYDIPYDKALSDARAKLLSDNIKWIAGRSNRKAWGEKVELTGHVATTVQMPSWLFGQIVEGQLTQQQPEADEPLPPQST